jgi:hypothetical protein
MFIKNGDPNPITAIYKEEIVSSKKTKKSLNLLKEKIALNEENAVSDKKDVPDSNKEK